MPAPIDDIEERKIKIMQQIDETKSMRELAVIVKNLPELCFGMPVEPHREQIYKHIEQRRKFFKEQQRIVEMLISERKNYLRNNPKLPAFASEIQIKVLTQLAIPTMENVSECLRVLKHGTLDEAKNMCYKINVNLLAHIKNKDWHYSVYVELMDRITDRMLELYKALIPTLTLDEMKERMARLRVEKQDAVYDLYPSSEYENALDLCLLLCRTSLNERTYKISAKQEASNDLEYTLRNLQKHNKKS